MNCREHVPARLIDESIATDAANASNDVPFIVCLPWRWALAEKRI